VRPCNSHTNELVASFCSRVLQPRGVGKGEMPVKDGIMIPKTQEATINKLACQNRLQGRAPQSAMQPASSFDSAVALHRRLSTLNGTVAQPIFWLCSVESATGRYSASSLRGGVAPVFWNRIAMQRIGPRWTLRLLQKPARWTVRYRSSHPRDRSRQARSSYSGSPTMEPYTIPAYPPACSANADRAQEIRHTYLQADRAGDRSGAGRPF
jgi:hypothetical protein